MARIRLLQHATPTQLVLCGSFIAVVVFQGFVSTRRGRDALLRRGAQGGPQAEARREFSNLLSSLAEGDESSSTAITTAVTTPNDHVSGGGTGRELGGCGTQCQEDYQCVGGTCTVCDLVTYRCRTANGFSGPQRLQDCGGSCTDNSNCPNDCSFCDNPSGVFREGTCKLDGTAVSGACGTLCTDNVDCPNVRSCSRCDNPSGRVNGGTCRSDINNVCGTSCFNSNDCFGTCSFCNGGFCQDSGGGGFNRGCGASCTDGRDCSGTCNRCNNPSGQFSQGFYQDPGGGGSVGGCVNNYQNLRSRLQRARVGEVITLCTGTINVNQNNPLVVNARDVTLRCQNVGRCFLDKQRRPNRIINWNGASGTIRGIGFRNAQNSGGNGGAVLVAGGGNTRIEQCSFSNNQGRLGGAIYANGNGQTTLSDCDFINNRANQGGAAYLESGNRNSGSFSNGGARNTATNCAGIFYRSTGQCESVNGGSGGGGFDDDYYDRTLCVSDQASLRNQINGNAQSIRICNGRTITVSPEIIVSRSNLDIACADGSLPCTLSGGKLNRIFSVSGNSNQFRGLRLIDGNARGQNGGAMYITGYNNEIDDCDIERNEANNGGGIYVDASRQVQIWLCSFTGNKATVQGGAAYVNFQARTNFVSSDSTVTNRGSTNEARQCNDIYNRNSGLCETFRTA